MNTSETHPKAHCHIWPLTCKVTLDEAHQIRQKATAQGTPVGRYLRECALNGHILQTHPIASEQWVSLARLAGNFNAIVRHANQGGVLDPQQVQDTLVQLLQLLGDIRSKLVA